MCACTFCWSSRVNPIVICKCMFKALVLCRVLPKHPHALRFFFILLVVITKTPWYEAALGILNKEKSVTIIKYERTINTKDNVSSGFQKFPSERQSIIERAHKPILFGAMPSLRLLLLFIVWLSLEISRTESTNFMVIIAAHK